MYNACKFEQRINEGNREVIFIQRGTTDSSPYTRWERVPQVRTDRQSLHPGRPQALQEIPHGRLRTCHKLETPRGIRMRRWRGRGERGRNKDEAAIIRHDLWDGRRLCTIPPRNCHALTRLRT